MMIVCLLLAPARLGINAINWWITFFEAFLVTRECFHFFVKRLVEVNIWIFHRTANRTWSRTNMHSSSWQTDSRGDKYTLMANRKSQDGVGLSILMIARLAIFRKCPTISKDFKNIDDYKKIEILKNSKIHKIFQKFRKLQKEILKTLKIS